MGAPLKFLFAALMSMVAIGVHSIRLDGKLIEPTERVFFFDTDPMAAAERSMRVLAPGASVRFRITHIWNLILENGKVDTMQQWSGPGPGRHELVFEYSFPVGSDPVAHTVHGPVLSNPVTIRATPNPYLR